MKRELKVTLAKAEIGELLIKPLTQRLRLPDGDHKCTSCNMDAESLVLVFEIVEKPAGAG